MNKIKVWAAGILAGLGAHLFRNSEEPTEHKLPPIGADRITAGRLDARELTVGHLSPAARYMEGRRQIRQAVLKTKREERIQHLPPEDSEGGLL